MEKRKYDSELDQARADSKRWRLISIAVIAIDLMLAIRILTLDTREKTIVIPATVTESFWVKGSQVSPTYLEQMARFYAGLALTYSPSSILEQKKLLLRYTDPAAHGVLDAKLTEDADRVARNKVSEVFYPTQTRVRQQSLEVAITGDLSTYVGQQQTSATSTTFVVKLINRDGQLFVSSFTEANNDTDPFGDRDSAATHGAERSAAPRP